MYKEGKRWEEEMKKEKSPAGKVNPKVTVKSQPESLPERKSGE
jgi:hypothetical protein